MHTFFRRWTKHFSVLSNDWVVTFGAALVLPIVLKLCSNKAQFIGMLILVGINFIILKILTLCFFINSIYLYFYFQYLSTFNIRKLLSILKYSKDLILSDFYSSSILIGDFHFYWSLFPVRYLYFYSSMAFRYFIHHWPVQIQLDTGMSVSLVSERLYKEKLKECPF